MKKREVTGSVVSAFVIDVEKYFSNFNDFVFAITKTALLAL
jgi:hypothetical protein